jgi:hypothetical protein
MINATLGRLRKRRPKLALSSRILASVAGVVATFILWWAFMATDEIQRSWCPPATFRSGELYSGALGVVLSSLLPISLVFLAAGLMGRYGLLLDAETELPLPPSRSSKVLIVLSTIGLAVSIGAFVDQADSYFCVSPRAVVIRRGALHAAHTLGWNDVQAVYAWCSTTSPRSGPSYKGGAIRLAFKDGETLVLGLTLHDQILTEEYKSLKKSLGAVDYQYYVNSSVTPDACPSGLFPLLWYWHQE